MKTINKLLIFGFSVFFGLSIAACEDTNGSNSTPSDSASVDTSTSSPSTSVGGSEHEHALTHVDAESATCTEAGNIEYWFCENCNSYFADAAATDSITLDNTIVPEKGHTEVTDAEVAATCTSSGLTAGSHCGVCQETIVTQEVVPEKGHTEVTDAEVAATCTSSGLTAGSHCGVCQETIVTQEVVPEKGHTEVTDAEVAATCTSSGLTAGSHCGVCQETIVAQEVVPEKGHTDISHVEAVAATCTEAGNVEYYSCGVCHNKFSDVDMTVGIDDVVIPATNHNVATTKSAGLPDLENGTAVYANFCLNPNCAYYENGETIQGPTEYANLISNEEELSGYFEINKNTSTYTFEFSGNVLTNTNHGIASSSAYLTLTAKNSGTFAFDTVTCTETGYDYFTISINGQQKYTSKNQGYKDIPLETSHTFTINANDTITFYKYADSGTFGTDSTGRSDYADIKNILFISKSAPADAEMIVVSFESNSDAVVAPVALFKDYALSALPAGPSKENYFFVDWYADEALTTKYDINTVLSADTTIYAGYIDAADACPIAGFYKGYNAYNVAFANRESQFSIDVVGRISAVINDSPVYGEIVDYDESTGLVTWKNESGTQGQIIYDSVSETFAMKNATPQTTLNLGSDYYIFAKCDVTATVSVISLDSKYEVKLFEFVIDGTTTKTLFVKDNKIYPNATYTSLFTENPSVANMRTITDVVVRDADNNIVAAVGYNGSKLVDLDSVYGIYTNAENTIKLSGLGKIALNDVEGTYVVDNDIVKATVGGVYYHITLDKENGTYTSVVPMASVIFDSVEGTVCEATDVNLTMPLGELPTTTKTGFVFMGWYDNAQYTGNPVTASYIVNNDVTLYAKWLAEVTLTINTNEGSTIDPIPTAATLPIESPVEPTRDGYRFDGYFCEETFENTFSFADGITEDTTIYVKWVKVWNVTINANNDSEATTVVVDDQTPYVVPSYVNPGSIFKGWYTTSTFDAGTEYVSGSAVTADVEIFAKWAAGKYTNDAANYIDAADTNEFISSIDFESAHPWATGSYNGSVWMVSTNQGVNNANDSISFTLAKNAVVSFDYIVNSESSYDYVKIYVNGTEKLSTKVSGMNGKDVTGNYTVVLNANDTVKITYLKDSSGNQGTDTAYVGNFVFETVEEVSLTYVYNDGVTENYVTTISKGTVISSLPAPERNGYVFLGWYTDETLETKYNGETIMAVTTLYASWMDVSTVQGMTRETAAEVGLIRDKEYTSVYVVPGQTEIWLKVTVSETNNFSSQYVYFSHTDAVSIRTNNFGTLTVYKDDSTTAVKTISSWYGSGTSCYASSLGELLKDTDVVVGETEYYFCISLKQQFADMTEIGFVIYY